MDRAGGGARLSLSYTSMAKNADQCKSLHIRIDAMSRPPVKFVLAAQAKFLIRDKSSEK